jgi:hypothetical protein
MGRWSGGLDCRAGCRVDCDGASNSTPIGECRQIFEQSAGSWTEVHPPLSAAGPPLNHVRLPRISAIDVPVAHDLRPMPVLLVVLRD